MSTARGINSGIRNERMRAHVFDVGIQNGEKQVLQSGIASLHSDYQPGEIDPIRYDEAFQEDRKILDLLRVPERRL